jgi:hypothetical protein
MTTDLSESNCIPAEPGELSSLRVSIIYEDFANGVRAKTCLDRLAKNLNVNPEEFSLRLWSFSYLSDPGLRSQAAREAARFEMIVIATRGCGEPPATVKEWMAEWLQYREAGPCALALMPDEREQKYVGGTALLRYMARVANTGGLDLVHTFGEPPAQPANHEIRDIAHRAINASPLLEGIVDDWQSYTHSYAHSGINE